MKKTVLIITMIFGFVFSGNAQSEKVKQKINKRIEKINKQIIASNPDAALTTDQREKIFDLLLTMRKNIKKIKKEHKGEDNQEKLIKAERKRINKIIYNEILTKEQKDARKATRLKNKKTRKIKKIRTRKINQNKNKKL